MELTRLNKIKTPAGSPVSVAKSRLIHEWIKKHYRDIELMGTDTLLFQNMLMTEKKTQHYICFGRKLDFLIATHNGAPTGLKRQLV